MKNRLKNADAAKKYREGLLQEQSGLDPILGIAIDHPVLDHQHYPPFKCRRVLQSEVNAFEGKIYNAYRRYIKHLTDKPLIEVLKALIVYLEADNSNRPIHHTAIRDELRPFKRAKAEDQIRILQGMGIKPAESSAKRVKQMRIAILSDSICYTDLIAKLK